jgi:hypothetical protein
MMSPNPVRRKRGRRTASRSCHTGEIMWISVGWGGAKFTFT